jgi:hypothetical protein
LGELRLRPDGLDAGEDAGEAPIFIVTTISFRGS